jgi:hypothetical protein
MLVDAEAAIFDSSVWRGIPRLLAAPHGPAIRSLLFANASSISSLSWATTVALNRIGFKYYDGLKCREPLGVSANKQTIVEARRLCATIQLELKPRTFDYIKRIPDSDRIKQRAGSPRPVRRWPCFTLVA